ncbi:MAG: hypothetical protein AB1597_02200 [Chloroflexota bacterium]
MATRISRLEEKVDQLTSLVTGLARDLKHFRSQAAEPPQEPGLEPRVGPDDYYGLYTVLFDDWLRGNRKGVVKKFRSLKLGDLLKMAEATSIPITQKTDKEALIGELREVFNARETEARAQQYSGLLCLLQAEWNADNRSFVEGRLNELSVAQLRDMAAGNAVKVSKTARRPGLILAIEKHLEAHKTPLTEEAAGPRKYRDPGDEALQYTHRVLFEEWNLGNCSYVYSQLENFDLDRLKRFISVNKLPIKETGDKGRIIEELGRVYEKLKGEAKGDQYHGLHLLLATEWRNNNRPFVNRRLQEMDQVRLAEFASVMGVKTGKRVGKEGLIKAIKDHLQTNPAGKARPSPDSHGRSAPSE